MATFKVHSQTGVGKTLTAEENSSLLQALLSAGYDVPHLCYHEALTPYGACRMCLVEVLKGRKRKLTTACDYPVKDGIEVFLDTDKVAENRKTVLQLLVSRCPGVEVLQGLAEKYGVDQVPFEDEADTCILCGLCERVCREAVGASAITFANRGDRKVLETPFSAPSDSCIGCASCAHICPTGHIQYTETPIGRNIWDRAFAKVRCSSCGKALVTAAQKKHLIATKGLSADYFELCDACKRPDVARGFARVGK